MDRPFSPARRRWLAALTGAGALAAAGRAGAGLADGWLMNPCLAALPPELAAHPLLLAAWRGLDPAQVWDCHVHLAGSGDSGSGIELGADMFSPLHPLQYLQRLFYLNAGCAGGAPGRIDQRYVERLHELMQDLPRGFKLMLYAFDRAHDQAGRPLPGHTALYVPDAYAREVARAAPQWFEWVCSVHPYRPDAIDALEAAAAAGARAVKWLPPAMGMDPSAPACDHYYDALVRLDLPLISHGGEEMAVHGAGRAGWGNPLLLRRPLERGVRVVVAHCASRGRHADVDRGADGPALPSFELFARLMDEPRFAANLFGDISAIALIDRAPAVLRTLLERRDWHPRLLFGSDYPLPGIPPVVWPGRLAAAGLLDEAAVPVLDAIRDYNPLLFDFVLKRQLASGGQRFAAGVFETRRFFDRKSA
jgi:mannonate dehydratase